MATPKKAYYKHHQKDTDADAKASSKTREIVISTQGQKLIAKLNDGSFIELTRDGFKDAISYASLAAAITAIGSSQVRFIISSAVTLTANLTIPSNIELEIVRGGSIALGGYTLTINGAFEARPFQVFSGGTVVFGNGAIDEAFSEWWGAKPDNSTDTYSAIVAAYTAWPVVRLLSGIYRYSATFAFTASQNGVSLLGSGLFSTTLQYTGVGDGLTMGGNVNGVTLRDFRLYSTTGRDAISITAGVASATPDAGVLYFARLDIRGWLRHAIKGRLTVNMNTEALQVVLNGGCGLYIENANPYRATTYVDKGSWFHENGGHGIALKGTFTHSFFGTISDTNNGLSTDADTISCAGYVLIGNTWTNCVASDIGKSVTQGGVVVGTLAHYDNTDHHMVINATAIPSGTGALAVVTGTGAALTSTVRKTNHGFYAARSAYIYISGGHFENHLYGIFLDSVYDSYIAPGYILTQGTGAYGFYAAGVCQRVFVPMLGVDVQAGGTAAAYKGPLCIGVNWNKPGAYTTVDRSANSLNTDTQNAGSTLVTLNSTGPDPFNSSTSDKRAGQFTGTDDVESILSVNNGGGISGRPTFAWRKDGTILARAFADNNLNSFVFKVGSNAFVHTNGTLEDVIQTNDANKFYIPMQGSSGPVVLELSNGAAEGAVSLGRWDGVARLNNGEVRAVIIEHNAIGTVANERGGQLTISTRTSGVSGASLTRITLDENGLLLSGRLQQKRGANVVSANDLTLGLDGSSFGVTGTTALNGIATANWQSGSVVKLFLLGAITVKHNTAPSAGFAKFSLQGAADFVGASGAVLTVEYDGTVWQETARRTA